MLKRNVAFLNYFIIELIPVPNIATVSILESVTYYKEELFCHIKTRIRIKTSRLSEFWRILTIRATFRYMSSATNSAQIFLVFVHPINSLCVSIKMEKRNFHVILYTPGSYPLCIIACCGCAVGLGFFIALIMDGRNY